VVGALAGALIASATWEPCTRTPTSWADMTCLTHASRGQQAAGGAVLGLLGGGVIGLVVGRSMGVQTWEPVVRVGTSARGRRAEFGLAVGFQRHRARGRVMNSGL
jgi:hypothetical protein